MSKDNLDPTAAEVMQQTESVNTSVSIDAIVLNAPQQMSEEERKRKESVEELMSYVVHADTEFEEEENLIEIGQVGCFAKKDLVAIKAKQKAGKSTMIGILIAALLCGKWNKVKKAVDRPVEILYIDTEMKERDTNKLNHKVLKMADLPIQEVEGLHFVNLRKLTTDECREIIPRFLDLFHPDIAFIDGIVDLVGDFNEVSQSQMIVREHLMFAEKYNCCMVEVLHTNKAGDDHNMRGHLGTILSQKSSNVFECVKDKDMNIVKVTCDDYRNAPVPTWNFAFDDHGNPMCADDIVEQMDADKKAEQERKKADKKKQEDDRRMAAVAKAYEQNAEYVRKDLKEFLMKELNLGDSCISDYIKNLMEDGILAPEGFNGKLVIKTSEDNN